MSKQRIKAIRCYQSVFFEGSQHNSFTIVEVPGRPNPTLDLIQVGENTDVIEIKTAKDCVHVPLTNVSGIYYFNTRDQEKDKLKKAEAEAKETNAKNAAKNKPKKPR